MIRSSVTVSLVEEARGGPFVLWDGLDRAFETAAELGFDGVEIFPPSAEAVDVAHVRRLMDEHGVAVAAVGTGAGWVRQKLTLTSPDGAVRDKARKFVRSIIDVAGRLSAPAIIGSMQGRWGDGMARGEAMAELAAAIENLADHASQHGQMLIYEPLNRYETNLVNTVADGVRFLQSIAVRNVRLLADLFHMNIEEASLHEAIRAGGRHIGHIHFVDSNRRPVGMGHIDMGPIAAAIEQIGYDGFLSAEALAYPNPREAAERTIAAFGKFFVAAR